MKKMQIDLNELLESEVAERVAERLAGDDDQIDGNVADSEFAASGKPSPPPPGPPPISG